jgi:hypothetical protein|nr:MAG TPA: hypothetical protein [Caudoviricetes sp.]
MKEYIVCDLLSKKKYLFLGNSIYSTIEYSGNYISAIMKGKRIIDWEITQFDNKMYRFDVKYCFKTCNKKITSFLIQTFIIKERELTKLKF